MLLEVNFDPDWKRRREGETALLLFRECLTNHQVGIECRSEWESASEVHDQTHIFLRFPIFQFHTAISSWIRLSLHLQTNPIFSPHSAIRIFIFLPFLSRLHGISEILRQQESQSLAKFGEERLNKKKEIWRSAVWSGPVGNESFSGTIIHAWLHVVECGSSPSYFSTEPNFLFEEK